MTRSSLKTKQKKIEGFVKVTYVTKRGEKKSKIMPAYELEQAKEKLRGKVRVYWVEELLEHFRGVYWDV